MCKTPVTLGGGITTVKGSRWSGTDLKYPFSIQLWYHFSSIAAGLYCLGISIGILLGCQN
jgi:hypothetical protein